MNTTTPSLWQDLNGRVVCPNHISEYHRLYLAARPDTLILFTPTTEWARLSAGEVTEWIATVGDASPCETCRWEATR